MDSSAKGSTSKSLRWQQAPDGKNYFINATQTSGGGKTSVSVALTRAEYWVFEKVRFLFV